MKGKVKIIETKYSINHGCLLTKEKEKKDMKRPAATLTKTQLAILNYHVLDESKI